jgi:zinc/manganese transport system substrate-binding protein
MLKINKPFLRIRFNLILLALLLTSACASTAPHNGSSPTLTPAQSQGQDFTALPVTGSTSAPKLISVVAAENFYGNLVQQLGAGLVSVVSIMSDPNVDPHEYESNVQDAIAVSNAQLVIENGDDYDTWMDKLLSASPNPNRTVLVATSIAAHKLPDNPHVWYGLDNIQAVAQAIAAALEKIDGADRAAFEANLAAFQQSLLPIQQKMDDLKKRYAGTPVGMTETIYLYQTGPIGLNVLTPFEFEKAIAEGNDPPADAVVTANDQITKHQVKVLIYNEQTVTPVTTNLQDEAKKANIPIVPVTETMPPGKSYQQWMLDQLNSLQQALGG